MRTTVLPLLSTDNNGHVEDPRNTNAPYALNITTSAAIVVSQNEGYNYEGGLPNRTAVTFDVDGGNYAVNVLEVSEEL